MASDLEGNYFVRLDAPPAPSRHALRERTPHWNPEPPRRPRRRRRLHIRPAAIPLLALLAWVGWAYTTPGGPSARIRSWIDHTRGVVEEATANPDLHQGATYLNGLYAQRGEYPNLSDAALHDNPSAGFTLGMTFTWCSPRDVVLQTQSSGGIVSRLLLDGKDLGNVLGAHPCPSSLKKPAPWTS